jgi:hypothetical protein
MKSTVVLFVVMISIYNIMSARYKANKGDQREGEKPKEKEEWRRVERRERED